MATLWIIDAYNFIRQSRRFSELEAHDGPRGRRAALEWLGKFTAKTGERVSVVFDAYSGLHDKMLEERYRGLTVFSSRGGYTADEEIIAMVKQNRERAVVISSDRAILEAAIKAGASILKSDEFERELAKILQEEPSDKGDEEIQARARRRRTKGRAFQPPKEKKKALALLRKYQ
ncbi:MAG TPA: hypothetical protein DF383_10385 [Deltaproteobacteria bacterium]|nr:hypothetical protein [Deltaproteobacteria bacterium]